MQVSPLVFRMCYNSFMELYRISDVLHSLQEALEPVEHAYSLVDPLEGRQPQARSAAVLLPLFELHGELTLVFIKRAATLRAHRGEIAFPGGSVDPSDASPIAAALREAQEEIGLEPAQVQVLGVLPPVFTVMSNYVITPVVAFLPHGLGPLKIQPSEVAELLQIPVQGLADPHIMHTEQWSRHGVERTVYFYVYGPWCIWGATGRMVHALLSLLARNREDYGLSTK
jgi:8-oxo-dGTP pyrophosphatase MutT (NUDIX family)